MLRLCLNSAEWDSRLGQHARYKGSCFIYISTIDLHYIDLDFAKILLDADGNRVEAVYRDLLFHKRLYFFPLQTLRSMN